MCANVSGLAKHGNCPTIGRMMTNPDPTRSTGLGRRLAAMLYDLFPLLGLWMLVAALFLLGFDAEPTFAPNPEPYLDPRDDDDDDYVEFVVSHGHDGYDGDGEADAVTDAFRALPLAEDPEKWENLYAEFMAERDE